MNITIIITFYNGINILKTCLEKLIETLPEQGITLTYEIIIVNDNPSICLDEIEKLYLNKLKLRIINMDENRGYSAACNIGVANARYENILLMDCDIIPYGNWLFNMTQSYDAINRKGSVSASIINMTSNTYFSYGVCIYGVDIILIKRNGKMSEYTSIDRDYPIVTSGCILMPKELYMSLGGQEEMMINAYNDFDITYKIYKMGYKNRMCSNAIVYHRGSVSGKIRHLPFKADAKALMFQRWGNELQTPTEEILEEIYREYCKLKNTNITVVNFSNSLFSDFYINKFCEIHSLVVLQHLRFKNITLEKIILNDYLSWDICRTNTPILYFVDDYTLLSSNYFWFVNRPVNNDTIFDVNANLISLNEIIKS